MYEFKLGQGAINGLREIYCSESELSQALSNINESGKAPKYKHGSTLVVTLEIGGLEVYMFDEVLNQWSIIS